MQMGTRLTRVYEFRVQGVGFIIAAPRRGQMHIETRKTNRKPPIGTPAVVNLGGAQNRKYFDIFRECIPPFPTDHQEGKGPGKTVRV